MGCSTLYHLAKLGMTDAILLERNQLTCGTTWHSAAQVRALRSTRNLTDLIRYSISLYSALEEETGQATGWINRGSLSIATTPDRMIHVRRQEALAHSFGLTATAISAGEAKERWPLMNADDVLGAVWSPDDGRVGPTDLCTALVKGAKARGARIFENTSVLGVTTEGGKIKGVETAGGFIQTDTVVICAGLWSREVAAMGGAHAPLYPCEHFYLLTKPVPGIEGNLPTLSDHDAGLYIRDDSGGLLVGCFEPLGKPIAPETLGEDFAFQLLPEDWDHFEPMMAGALNRLPALETAEVKMLLNGPESFTPDGAFMLGETAETQGLYLGCGMNSVGVASGGGAGMALATMIVEGAPPADLSGVDPKRFSDAFNSAEALAARAPEVLGKHYEITYPGRQWTSQRNLQPTPCHRVWTQHDAHFGQVDGWERPLYFNKKSDPVLTFARPDWQDAVTAEVMAAHASAAVFEQSTFGKILVSGADAESFLNRVCTNDMARATSRMIYTLMLNDRGGVESDLTAMRLKNDQYRLFVGTMALKRDMAWLKRSINPGERVTFQDETYDLAVLGLMGPNAPDIARSVGAEALLDLKYFGHGQAMIAGRTVRGARLSYVGETGWEITCASSDAPFVLTALVDAGARPAGGFAQTSMRIEKGFLAYGHDMDTDLDPLQLGLSFTVAWDTAFIGREALEARRQKPGKRKMATIVLSDQDVWPHGNEPVYCGDKIVGMTTSAAYGVRVGAPVALALLDENTCVGPVEIDIAGKRALGTAQSDPAFDPKGARMR
jgi:glycine cleavage system aminomethyltransferase T/glycine/D-amino acid oxidase-like deaminating enzyme